MKVLYVPATFAVVLFAVPPLLANLGVLPGFVAFLLCIGSLVPATLAIMVGAFATSRGLVKHGLISLAVGLLPISVIGYGAFEGRHFPPINDIATNLDNPPALTAAAAAPENQDKDLSYPEEFRASVLKAYPDLISLQLDEAPAEAFARVRAAAEKMPDWRIVRVDADALTLEGEATAGVFRFTDDFVIRVTPMDGTSQVDMRSRSRVGQADFGANAKRIRQFFGRLSGTSGSPIPF